MKIFDCFMFSDEEMLLDLRLNCLNERVDQFVIVESEYLHNGQKKKPLFNISNYSKFKDKIRYILVQNEPEGLRTYESKNDPRYSEKIILNALLRENFQRNQISKGIKDAEENDFIMISDLDEIPKLENIKLNNINNKFILFKQKAFYYKFNLHLESLEWYGTKACKKKFLKSPQSLRNIKDKKYPIWRIDSFFSEKKQTDIHFVRDGGWHFAYIKKPEDVERKLKSFLHHIEYDENPIGLEKIKKIMEEKKIVYNYKADQRENKFDSSEILKIVQLKEMPDYLLKNIHKYKNWIEQQN